MIDQKWVLGLILYYFQSSSRERYAKTMSVEQRWANIVIGGQLKTNESKLTTKYL